MTTDQNNPFQMPLRQILQIIRWPMPQHDWALLNAFQLFVLRQKHNYYTLFIGNIAITSEWYHQLFLN